MAIATTVPYAPENGRRLRDYNYIANKAGPAAAANANTAALDLIQPQWQSGQTTPNTGENGPYAVTERFWVNLSVTASTTTANNKNINVCLETTGALANGAVDSGNFANIVGVPQPTLQAVDNNNAGTTAQAINIMLPPTGVKRFIRAKTYLEANGGTAANSTTSLQLLF
jgi:hypothetical protein